MGTSAWLSSGPLARAGGRHERGIILRTITIDEKWCKRCRLCSAFCPKKVFDVDEDGRPIPARAQECVGCRQCEMRCPDFAISVEG